MSSKPTEEEKKIDSINVEEIEEKIALIEKGLPIDIAEEELCDLELVLRNARSLYIDILNALDKRKQAGETGEEFDQNIIDEQGNLAGVELALRRIDEFRAKHADQIKDEKKAA